MLDVINTAALEIQAALLARSLYPLGHPRVKAREDEAMRLLRQVLAERPSVRLFAVDERVVCGDEVLPASASLATLFRLLHRHGVDSITFRRGVEDEELCGVLDKLSRADSTGAGRLESSPNVRFGYIDGSDDGTDLALTAGLENVLPLAESSDSLERVLGSAFENQTLQVELVGCLVATVSRVVNSNVGAMLPLAPLKRHDEYTFVHTINVAILSTALAEALGFASRTVRDLSIAALLHDVGKQIVPPEVLNKNGRFSDEEFRLVQLHPVEGARILFNTPGVPTVAPIVAYEHHVRADGSGYPDIPPGWKPSLASRVVQVADVFDALRTHRPYRKALELNKILDIMNADAGPFFDAEILDVFFRDVVSRGIPEPETTPD